MNHYIVSYNNGVKCGQFDIQAKNMTDARNWAKKTMAKLGMKKWDFHIYRFGGMKNEK